MVLGKFEVSLKNKILNRSKKVIKIIHVFGSLDIGGAESRVMDIFRKIDKFKVQFHFITLDSKENQFYEDEIKSLKGEVIKINSPRKVGFIKHFFELLEIFKINNEDGNLIVHSHTLHHCGIVMLAAKLSKVRIRISQARSSNSQHKGFVNNLMVGIGRFLISLCATEKLAITDSSAKFLFYKRDIINKKVKIVPNAIELDLYKNILTYQIDDIKNQNNLSSEKTIIGHVGRFEKMKNHKFLINLFSRYYLQNPSSVLVLIGDGSLKKEIQQLVTNLKLKDHVLFLGIRNDVNIWMKIFDVVLLPSLFEGLPGVVSESQAAGTPCVLSDNITRKSDLNLGLLNYIKLSSGFDTWIDAINESLKLKKIPFDTIEKKFDENNLSLNKGIESLYKIYKVSQ